MKVAIPFSPSAIAIGISGFAYWSPDVSNWIGFWFGVIGVLLTLAVAKISSAS